MQLETVKDYKVLVAGDAIYDRYRFCHSQGRGTKESVLSVKFDHQQEYLGGVWASSLHLTDLCETVAVWHGDSATINTKYLVEYSKQLFSEHDSKPIQATPVPEDIGFYDLVIVFDYGHGFFKTELRNRIMRDAKFLAVNAQSNSSNYGFNRVNEKWPSAHLCVVDELEARLAAHEQEAPIEDVILKLNYPKTIVTLGAQGAIGYGNREFYREQALTDRPIDLLGAGDAVLAVVAPFAKAGCSIKELVHLGNVAGLIKVSILGHQRHITKEELEKHL